MTQMRLLINGLPTQVGGGATVWRALCAGSQSEALLLCRSEAAADFVSRDLSNVRVELANSGKRGVLSEPVALRNAAQSFRPDVVLTHNRASVMPSVKVPQVALHVNLSRFIGRSDINMAGRAADLVRDELTKWSLRSADANIFESAHLLAAARDRYPNVKITRPSVSYVGVEASWTRAPDSDAPLAGHTSRRLISVTSPNPHKDNHQLIALLQELHQHDSSWRLAIVGGRDISFWSDLIALAEAAGVREHIDFLGFLSRPELAQELDRSFALVSPSLVESFAMVPLEAMARGVPAIVTDRPAMPESVDDCALVVPASDPSAMSQAIMELTESSEWDRLSRRGRERATALSWESFADSVISTVAGLTA